MTARITAGFRLSIAGVTLDVSFPGRPAMLADEPAYRQFIEPSPPHQVPGSVVVRVESGRPSLPDGAVRLGRGGDAWTIHALGRRRCILFAPPGFERAPLWMAVFDPETREVAVTCGKTMIVENGEAIENPLRYPLDQLLFIYLLAGEGLLVHAAGAEVGGRGLLFPGVSGAGKSTVSRLLENHPGAFVLSDDRVVLRPEADGWRMHGTPWPGEGGQARRASAPASAMFFLEKAPLNEITALSPTETLSRLLPVLSVPWFDEEVLGSCLETVDRVMRGLQAKLFRFRPEPGALAVIFPGSQVPRERTTRAEPPGIPG